MDMEEVILKFISDCGLAMPVPFGGVDRCDWCYSHLNVFNRHSQKNDRKMPREQVDYGGVTYVVCSRCSKRLTQAEKGYEPRFLSDGNNDAHWAWIRFNGMSVKDKIWHSSDTALAACLVECMKKRISRMNKETKAA